MNTQTSDFSAVYGGHPGGSMQPTMEREQQQQPSSFMGSTGSSGMAGMVGMRQETAPAQPMQSIGFPASGGGMPISDLNQQQPISTESVQFLNGFLRTQIGNRVRVEFLVGTNTYLEKSGKLMAVGANYIILQEAMSDDLLVCDFFNIKFVTIFR